MMMMNKRKPHFLEVFLPNLSSDRLKVPSKFVEHLGDRTSESLSLIGPSGNIWHVNLLEYNGHLYFRDGWPTFVKDHFLQCGDTLIFGYDGNSNFTVQIFDESSCEKDEAFSAHCSQGDSECNENLGKKRERDKDASMLTLVAEKKIRGSWDLEPIYPELSAGSSEQMFDVRTKEVQKVKETVTSGRADRTNNIVKASDTMVVLAMPAIAKSKQMSSLVNFQFRKIVSNVNKASKKKKSCKKKNACKRKPTKITKPKSETDMQKISNMSKFLESSVARHLTSTFPYFVRSMCYSNISGNGTMKIPMHFSTVHFPSCKFQVTLMNLDGNCWIVNTIPTVKRQSTMLSFCGGWLAFVGANSIKIEDVCIFELVGKYEMRVRILRLGMEGLECPIASSVINVDGLESNERRLEMGESAVQDTGIHPSKDFVQTNEPCTHLNGNNEKITDIMPYTQQEAESSIDIGDYLIDVQDPAFVSVSSNAIGEYYIADELLASNVEETNSSQRRRSNRVDVQVQKTVHVKPVAEIARDALSFYSPFPNFTKVMTSSNVGGKFAMVIPSKFSAAHLPCHTTDIVLRNLRGDSWDVVAGYYGQQTRFSTGWKSFVHMNDVKLGDTCIFELLDENVFQVRVFKNTQKGQEHVNNGDVADDLTTTIESTQCGVLPET